MRDIKTFYEEHLNFSLRTTLDYHISPGIKCKFDILKKILGDGFPIYRAIDLGSSGNSFLMSFKKRFHRVLVDIALKPLFNYTSIINQRYKDFSLKFNSLNHPICADLSNLPFRNNSFDFISALDVLEHIEEDDLALKEINRLLMNHSILVLTVPHKMEYFSKQDELIGHHRRYEINELILNLKKINLNILRKFGVYGKLMLISRIQAKNPQKTEEGLISLRERYKNNLMFRKVWDVIAFLLSKLMRIDARINGVQNCMNIGLIFSKRDKI